MVGGGSRMPRRVTSRSRSVSASPGGMPGPRAARKRARAARSRRVVHRRIGAQRRHRLEQQRRLLLLQRQQHLVDNASSRADRPRSISPSRPSSSSSTLPGCGSPWKRSPASIERICEPHSASASSRASAGRSAGSSSASVRPASAPARGHLRRSLVDHPRHVHARLALDRRGDLAHAAGLDPKVELAAKPLRELVAKAATPNLRPQAVPRSARPASQPAIARSRSTIVRSPAGPAAPTRPSSSSDLGGGRRPRRAACRAPPAPRAAAGRAGVAHRELTQLRRRQHRGRRPPRARWNARGSAAPSSAGSRPPCPSAAQTQQRAPGRAARRSRDRPGAAGDAQREADPSKRVLKVWTVGTGRRTRFERWPRPRRPPPNSSSSTTIAPIVAISWNGNAPSRIRSKSAAWSASTDGTSSRTARRCPASRPARRRPAAGPTSPSARPAGRGPARRNPATEADSRVSRASLDASAQRRTCRGADAPLQHPHAVCSRHVRST